MTNLQTPTFSRFRTTALAVLAMVFCAWMGAAAQTSGYHDYTYGSSISAPTDSKPESKLWFNDGLWWGVLFNPTLQGFNIYKLDLNSQVWSDTGTTVDDRATSRADALWDQAAGKLYIVSNLHVDNGQPNNTSSNWGRLYRYSYNSGTKTYSLDAGFPVTVTKGREETLTIAKDSNGKLWVTYVEAGKVMINHSSGTDTSWGTPTVLPVGTTATTVTTDDIATIIAFGGNKIGVLWSNQTTQRDYFAVHPDSNADATWLAEETAYGGGVNCTGACSDDHLNIKADSTGKIFAVVKTSFVNDTDPFIVLLTRSTSGTWSAFTESQHLNTNTRGIVLLDEQHNRLYILVSSNEAGGNIVFKTSSMSSPSFTVAGQGDLFIDNPADAHLNNATSTKQNLSTTTGMLVQSGDDTTDSYAHNYVNLPVSGAPLIVAANPNAGLAGTSVTITGLNFTGATSVKFNGVTASTSGNTGSQITATVPNTATTGFITIINSSGTGTSGSPFQVTLPAPIISSISPTSGLVGSSVTINGSKFAGITNVAFNGVPATFTVNSAANITATVPADATAGKITVTNNGGTATSSSTYTVKPAFTPSPASGAIGLPIVLNGTSLAGTTSVKFNSNKTAAFTVVSNTQVNTTVPTGATTGNITLITPGGTATAAFAVAPPVIVNGFSPASGPVGTTVTVTGSGFGSPQGTSTISFNGVLGSPTAWSSTSITVKVPSGATKGAITVNGPGGPGSSAASFLVTPVISGFTPTSGGSGTVVTITGTSFTGATAVKFNGTTATFTVTDDSHISATVPSGATTGTITVTTPGGTATSTNFTVNPPPSVTGFTPGGGGVGTAVIITGNNFGATQGTSTVKFNGTAATSIANWTNTSITAQVPASATIGPITVTTVNGVGTSATNFVPAPVITSFAPTSGVTGTSVLLTGINFTGATAVSFNGGIATTVTVDSDTSIHASVPATGTTGQISVTTPNGGTGSSASNFTVNPLITSLSSQAAPIGSPLTINGSGFGATQGTSTVTFNGVSAGAASSWGPTSITVQPPNSQGTYTVLVVVAGVSSNGVQYQVTHAPGSVPPTISSFNPFEAIAGTTVTLTGADFTGTTAVSFNGTAATILPGGTDSQISVTVPAGATSGPISVTNGAGTTISVASFVVSNLVRNMTFENGALVNTTTGGDSLGGTNSGSFVVDTNAALKDVYSAHIPGISDAYLNKTFNPSIDDLYETFYLRVNATHTTAALVTQLTASGGAPAGGTLGEIRVTAANNLQLTRNGTTIGATPSPLTVGTVYRVLLHQKKGTGANGIIEAYVAQGEAAFTTAFASKTNDTFTNGVASLKIGNLSTGTNTIDLTFDNVQLDSAIPQGQAPPLITSLSPTGGPVGTNVTITGLHFGATTGAVTFNGIAATPTNWTDTSITVPVPVGATSGNVVVTNTNNVSSNGSPFAVGGTISDFTPTSAAAGATVTINGSNLGGATQVTINGTAANIGTNTSTQIVVTVGAATSGSGPIVVTTPNGTATSLTSFTVVPPPSITSLSAPSGAVGLSLTITGTNFGPTQVTGSSVTFNGTTAPVTSWSDTSIVVPVPAGATTGNVVVNVANVASNGSPFTVTPGITSLNPTSGAVGASVVITGTSFGATQGGSSVTFNGIPVTSVSNWSDTSITAVVPASATSGNVVVTVGGNPSNGSNFTVVPPPSISGLSAGSGPAGSSITVNGTSFGATQGSSTVKFNGVTATVSGTWTDTSIPVTVPTGLAAGPVNVTVTVGGVPSNNSPFTVLPSINTVTPASGTANTPILINGTSFGSPQGTSTVTVNGLLAGTASNWSDTSISINVPVGATSGIGNVVVTVNGQSSNGFTFNVVPPPSITGFSPGASGYAGQQVTVQGTNFGASQGASTVKFGTTIAAVSGTWSDTAIQVQVPNISTGSTNVVVTVSNQPSNAASFMVVPNLVPPTINSFTPTAGSGGTLVTISGANFSGTTDVKFNGLSTSFSLDSDAQITALVPTGVTTGPITVTNGGGPTTSSTNFTATLIKLSTFEAGTLTDPATGVTSTSGAGVSMETITPLKGQFSGHVNAGNSWLQDTFAGKDDIYASFYLRLNALPTGAVRIVMFSDGGTTVGNFNLTTAGALTLRNGTTNIGSNSALLTVGQIYRVALHQKKGTGNNAVLEGFLAVGDAAFGVPFASTSTGTWTTQADTLKIGGTIASPAPDLTADNIQLDLTLPFSAPAPTISSFNPTTGTPGTTVTITGTNFGATQSGGSVKFNGVIATPTTWSATSIVVSVPGAATTGPITVITAGGTASTSSLATPNFTIAASTPTITDFNPPSGPVGTQITINGTNLSSPTSVTVNGTPVASIDSNNASQIKVTVASGTTGSGPIVVNTPGGQATSSTNFTVGSAPTVTAFNPTAGLVGASVVITGTNFTGATSVKFNGTAATPFSVDNDGQITTTVPSGASSGTVSVTTGNGTGTSTVTFTVGAPTVTNFTPAGGPVATSVTITGTNFGGSQGTSLVKFNGTTAIGVTNWSDTSITVPVPAGAATGTVSVTTPAGTGTSANSYTVGTVPVVSNFTPAGGPVGTTVTITGTSFGASQGTSTVNFNGTAAPGATWSDTSITVAVPAGASSGSISVITPTGTGTSANSFTVGAAPTVTSFNPLGGPVGTSVTITGTNFGATQGTGTVKFGATQATTVGPWGATSITATVPAGAASGPISVTTATGTGASATNFTVGSGPTVTSFAPTAGLVGSSVVITGTSFTGATAVKFNGTAAITFSVDTDLQITATVPAGATSGVISVTTGAGTGNSANPFTVGAPTVTNFTPAGGQTGTSVTVTGTNFGSPQGTSVLKFNGIQATINTWSDTSITATVPGGAITGTVAVTTGAGTGTSASSFVVGPAPTVSNFSPPGGPVGTSVIITGTGFGATQDTSTVKFNTTIATSVTAWSDTSITAAVPAAATTGTVSVTTATGTGTSSSSFTVGAAPTVTGFNPLGGPIGASVTISGTGFGATQGAGIVKFGATQATSVGPWSDTSITATVPAGASTGAISVTTATGTGTSSTNFTVGAAPVVNGFNPPSGVVGASIVISGTGFTGASAVKFNSTAATSFSVDSDIQITAAVPAGATSGPISVTTVTGTGASGTSFTVTPPAPAISSFSPTSGPTGTQVTINGVNLGSASSVTIAGAAAAINSNTPNQIVATVGASASGSGLVTVSTPGGSADSSLLGTPNFTVTSVGGSNPVITSFTPATGAAGTLVTINGSNFTNTNSVKFNGASATFNFVSDVQLTTTVPAGATNGPISVTNASGIGDTTGLNPANFLVSRLKDITFEAGSLTGASGFSTTTGTVNLETGSPIKGADSFTINAGNSYGTQTFTASDEIFISTYIRIPVVPSSQVRVIRITDGGTSVGAITLEPTGKITLRNGTSNIGASAAALTPGAVYRVGIHQKKGTGNNAVLEGFLATGDSVFGAPFAASSTQTFITQADQVQIGSSTGTVATATFDDIRIDNGSMPGPSGSLSASAPNVTGFNPLSGPPGTSVIISGMNFGTSQGASTVSFGGTGAVDITDWGDTTITATVPTGAVTGSISITTAAGTGASSTNFTVVLTPSVSGFTPPSGAAGNSVTISGSNFGATQGTGTVAFNGMSASVNNWSNNSITAVVPSGATGGTISVTTDGGTGTSSNSFTVLPGPTITNFNPTSGPVATSVTITGTNFGATTGTVSFNGTAATVTNWADTSITTSVPPGATSGSISVTNANGTATSANSFTVTAPAPAISGFSPNSGPAGTTQVTITGTNLSNASSVTIAGTAATINNNTATQILATVGASATGSGLIALTTPGGSADSHLLGTPNFTVTVAAPPSPVITSFTPTSGPIGTLVTIHGSNFTNTNSVKFNGTSATFNFVNDTQLTATVPAGATTGKISVTTGGGTTDTTSVVPASFTMSASSRLNDITFEAASLTGASGFGSATGTVSLETAAPIKGADSMTISGGNSYGTQPFTASDEVFISLYIRILSPPTGQIRVIRITDGGTSVGALTLETTGKITLRNGTSNLGASAAALVPGTIYRIGIHQKKGAGSNAVLEGFLATGDAAFSTPFAASSTQTFTTLADQVQVGSSTGVVGSATFDDIRIDNGSMPGPSLP